MPLKEGDRCERKMTVYTEKNVTCVTSLIILALKFNTYDIKVTLNLQSGRFDKMFGLFFGVQ